MFSSRFTRVLHSWLVFEEKVIADFARLMHCPDAFSYLSRIESSVAQLAVFDLPKNMVSSAKSRWFIGGQLRATFTPGSGPFSRALLHSPDSTSVHIMNRYGESGFHCSFK